MRARRAEAYQMCILVSRYVYTDFAMTQFWWHSYRVLAFQVVSIQVQEPNLEHWTALALPCRTPPDAGHPGKNTVIIRHASNHVS